MVPVYVFDCVYCKNVRKDDKYRLICGAYPKGFPEEIVHSIIKPHELKECDLVVIICYHEPET